MVVFIGLVIIWFLINLQKIICNIVSFCIGITHSQYTDEYRVWNDTGKRFFVYGYIGHGRWSIGNCGKKNVLTLTRKQIESETHPWNGTFPI